MLQVQINFKSIKKLDKLQQKNSKIKNIFCVKNRKKILTVLKSPHVNKKAREQFIYQYYNKKVRINFKNIFKLINFIIIVKKIEINNIEINFQILKI